MAGAITDDAIVEMPHDLNPDGLQEWFDSNMISNGGSNGFLTHREALELLRNRAPATAAYMDSVRADSWADALLMVKSAIFTDSLDHLDFLFNGKIEQLRSGTHDTAEKAG